MRGLFLFCAFLIGVEISSAASVTLAWDPSPEPDVAKYVLYQGVASGQYTRQIDVTNRTSGVLATTNTVTGLANGTTYYFVVTARNSAGLESPPSNEIAYTTPMAANQPPTITCPSNVTGVEATGPTGAPVYYSSPRATDPDSPTPTVTSVPVSGSVFPIGTTTVVCTAKDSSGNTATCSFTVTVVDTRPPSMSCPADITGVQATSSSGAVVTYTPPTAFDLVDGARPVTCTPASGSTFPVGTTTVTCTAKDSRGNTTTCRFAVTVVGPQLQGTVVGRYVFYNNSAWDGKDLAANAADDLAIAPDKTALRPGGTATFANYTSYSRGLNGVMVDIAGLGGTPIATDFGFRVGNDNNPTNWAAAPTPSQVIVRARGGVGGADRVTLRWADGAIQKQWLQVTIRPTLNTGLKDPDVFYFGNAIAETGDRTTDAIVDDTDALLVVYNQRGAENPAGIDFRYDFDRNRLVDSADTLIARINNTSQSGRLLLIAPDSASAPKLTDDWDDPPPPPDDSGAEPGLESMKLPPSAPIADTAPVPADLQIRYDVDGALLVECTADPSLPWQLQSCTHLAAPVWQNENIRPKALGGGLHRWRVVIAPGVETRFYRVALGSYNLPNSK